MNGYIQARRPAIALMMLLGSVARPAAQERDAEIARLSALVAAEQVHLSELQKEVERRREAMAALVVALDAVANRRDAPAAPAAETRAKAQTDAPPTVVDATPVRHWYDHMSLRGYGQLRYAEVFGTQALPLEVSSDRSASPTETFMLRRGRLIISGDVSSHLSFFLQPEMIASTAAGDAVASIRDAYADIHLDRAKSFRLRVGQAKVPFGFVNLQSSQQRAPLERPDALNSAVEGERDLGAYLMWAPPAAKKLLAELSSNGLKGSGDNGVVAVGAYGGQGLNRPDVNGRLHWIARASYPFRLRNGQIAEFGVQGYTGPFVPSTQAIQSNGTSITPQAPVNGLADRRVALSATWYPQPLGVEAEWNWGRSPELSDDLRTIDARGLSGGYVQLHYRRPERSTTWFPFVRWQYFDGGRKAARNTPRLRTNEVDVGVKLAHWGELETTAMFTHTLRRTRTSTFPYSDVTNVNRLGLQLQWNY